MELENQGADLGLSISSSQSSNSSHGPVPSITCEETHCWPCCWPVSATRDIFPKQVLSLCSGLAWGIFQLETLVECWAGVLAGLTHRQCLAEGDRRPGQDCAMSLPGREGTVSHPAA